MGHKVPSSLSRLAVRDDVFFVHYGPHPLARQTEQLLTKLWGVAPAQTTRRCLHGDGHGLEPRGRN